MFHFSRSQGVFNSPPLDLTPLGGPILHSKNTWYYLRFIFNQKLLFQQHINFYTNNTISTIKCMKMLGNSLRGLNPIQKKCLYKYCILSIVLYDFQLWYYNKAPRAYLLKELGKMQRRVAIWITGVFCTSPMLDIEVIASLISIHLHLQKFIGRFHLQAHSLSPNHIINSILNLRNSSNQEPHWLSLDKLTPRQHSIIKDSLVDMDNRCNKIFPSFSSSNYEFSLRNRLIDIFPNCFSFHALNRKNNHDIKSYLQCLNNITIQVSSDPLSVVVVMDTSIKNQVAISISHINSHNKPVIKTIYYVVNVMSVMVCLDTNLFLFLLSIFLDFVFLFLWLFFFFSFLFFDNEEACDCSHMACHMM